MPTITEYQGFTGPRNMNLPAGGIKNSGNWPTVLLPAYDESDPACLFTLAGWTRVLEHHDSETEEHSQRVSSMTVQLARALGVRESDLVHVRRGALLHDIGKMGVPEHILFKPGKLTDEEWAIMRQHPRHAYELLAHIPMLRQALDIPYYHHERWDGKGYPAGLRGGDIPLAARATAVIDVWDALNSDRPYRKAWPVEQVMTYIRAESGTHFDPQVVDVFFQII
jgi:putative nucleotidyltransferase with HDIG domain